MRDWCAAQIARDAGSFAPTASRSPSAAIGRPGSVASSRSRASARDGGRKRRAPQASAASSARPAAADPAHTASSGSASCAPSISAASARSATLQAGQKARASRSAAMPSRVSASGRASPRSGSNPCGSLGRGASGRGSVIGASRGRRRPKGRGADAKPAG